ncbi:hypothetical protein Ddc_10977 [Ditylenchus destructor]|nr:hypothetical protein Ddc_10977 [Ditylenchus destructor]
MSSSDAMISFVCIRSSKNIVQISSLYCLLLLLNRISYSAAISEEKLTPDETTEESTEPDESPLWQIFIRPKFAFSDPEPTFENSRPDPEYGVVSIDPISADVTLQLHITSGGLPRGRQLMLFVRPITTFSFVLLPPELKCMEREKRATIALGRGRGCEFEFYWVSGITENEFFFIDHSAKYNARIFVPNYPASHVVVKIDENGLSFWSGSCTEYDGTSANEYCSFNRKGFYRGCNFSEGVRPELATTVGLDADPYFYFIDFAIANVENPNWDYSNLVPFWDCTYKVLFKGHTYRVMRNYSQFAPFEGREWLVEKLPPFLPPNATEEDQVTTTNETATTENHGRNSIQVEWSLIFMSDFCNFNSLMEICFVNVFGYNPYFESMPILNPKREISDRL